MKNIIHHVVFLCLTINLLLILFIISSSFSDCNPIQICSNCCCISDGMDIVDVDCDVDVVDVDVFVDLVCGFRRPCLRGMLFLNEVYSYKQKKKNRESSTL